ncbi:MAG: hypothetical protein ACRC9R_09155 [Enterovibrio sp.]
MKNKIYSAYEGEIYGISFFSYFVENYHDLGHLDLFTKLVEVETMTAQLLKDWLLANGTQCSEMQMQMQMQSKGIKDAKEWIDLEWPSLLKTLVAWVEPYELTYRAWFGGAAEHIDVFKIIADHETAIYLSLCAELRGESGLMFLDHFIEQNSN